MRLRISQHRHCLPPPQRRVDQWRKDRGLPLPSLEGRKEERKRRLGLSEPQRWTPLYPNTLFPWAHPKADMAHTESQAVRSAAGAKARSMSLQLPAGDKLAQGPAWPALRVPLAHPPGLPRGSLCKA